MTQNKSSVQTELLVENDKEVKKPRDSKTPILKNTDASPSAFGWRFQVIAAIIFSLKNIRDLDYVVVEGKTEDIEIYFKDKSPEYIQVKSIQKNYLEAKDPAKATAAMNTLINTSNIVKNEYSCLRYVVNFMNPLSLPKSTLSAFWVPRAQYIFSKSYDEIVTSHSPSKKFLDDRISAAQSQLNDGGHISSKDFFDTAKVAISTLLFSSSEQSNTSEILRTQIEDILDDCNLNSNKVLRVHDNLVNEYFGSAAAPNSGYYSKIHKSDLIWKILAICFQNSENEALQKMDLDMPFEIENDVQSYIDDFISDQTNNISVINKVYAELSKCSKGRISNKERIESFINNNWTLFQDDFPLDDDDEIQEFGIKSLLVIILYRQRTVNKIKEKVKLI